MTYQELKSSGDFEGNIIPYAHLLKCNEWNEFRDTILKRDKFRCTNCGYDASEPFYDEDNGGWFKWVWGNRSVEVLEELYRFEKMPEEDKYTLEYDELLETLNNHGYPYTMEKVENPRHLQAHHRYYVLDRLPWEYHPLALDALCNVCHKEFHAKNTVPVFHKTGDTNIRSMTPCFRCNGMGYFPEYYHVQQGICFRCNGNRYEELIR